MRVLVLGAINSPHTEDLALGARARGAEVVVGGGEALHLPPTVLIDEGLDVSVARLPTSRWIRRLMAHVRPDVVHANWFPDAFRYLIYGATPMVASAWGSDIYRAGPIARLENRVVARCAGVVMADSIDLLGELYALGASPARGVLFNWGVDLDAFSPLVASRSELRRKLGLPEGRMILSPRSLRAIYNPRTIIDAFEMLASTDRDLHLVLKHMHDDPPDLGALRFPDRVHIIGHVPYVEMADYYRAADVCISIPSSDSSPRSVWEAMSCGTPCVVSDLPWVDELLSNERDVLVVPVEAAAVAVAAERLLSDPELASRTATRGRAVVERHRNRELQLDCLIEVYERVARERRGTSRPVQLLQSFAAAAATPASLVRQGVVRVRAAA